MPKLAAKNKLFIGCEQAHTVLYLHSSLPNLPENFEQLDSAILTQQLLLNNNNNWRKILTIYAKLTAPDDNWREYLQQGLLAEQQINFGDKIVSKAKQHIIAGKNNWQRFDHIVQPKDVISHKKLQFIAANILLCPYPDYRQFPNILVAEYRHWQDEAKREYF
ncbi:DUF6942 family protein [Agarivorans sp. QJM3NY_25]|uniref:DUF6942 family protein n=1 Tax=Agarivorans sp. QJM3NY_25 TaxID=3421430 RepID=UPI003D7E2F81